MRWRRSTATKAMVTTTGASLSSAYAEKCFESSSCLPPCMLAGGSTSGSASSSSKSKPHVSSASSVPYGNTREWRGTDQCFRRALHTGQLGGKVWACSALFEPAQLH
jgi:hypothetical protein